MSKREEKGVNSNDKLLLVTSNENKFREISEVAKSYGIKIEWLNIPKFEIQADNLEEIVRYSAITIYQVIRKPLIVEDSGLFINALNGFPGPYTNYVRRKLGLEGILKLLNNVEDRSAYFKTVMCYVSDKEINLFTGVVNGRISERIRGEKGFGFDPIFIPENEERTFAEMSTEEKNKYSHRAKAFMSFLNYYMRENRKT
ncbi:XTP/dITP diphosphatase [Stygiolobus azoricus]|uniref:dITP/XTP pyrophosphatase n=1 Tax=Stygiolobus azoricus TaxID=41675 RepID=A0A650CMS8_9CREN|nr:XTP/dITP diphosphatase [Stygiolobus azoricus]QGR18985.1 XTP/dITP diphosphatase [Stygiolobus azoricus]